MKHFKQAFNGVTSTESYSETYTGSIDMMGLSITRLSKDLEMGFESLLNSMSQIDIIRKQIKHLDNSAVVTGISKESLINTCNICNSIGTSIGISTDSLINIEKIESISFTNKAYSITKENFNDITDIIASKITEIIRKIINWLADLLKNFTNRHKGLLKNTHKLIELYKETAKSTGIEEFQLDLNKYCSRYNILTTSLMGTDSFNRLPMYVSEIFDLIKNHELDTIIQKELTEDKTLKIDYAGQNHLKDFVNAITATTERDFIIPQEFQSVTPILGPNKIVETKFDNTGAIEDFVTDFIVKGKVEVIIPTFGSKDSTELNYCINNIENSDPSTGLDRIKRYMEALKVPGTANNGGNEEIILRHLSIMKKALKITTIASTFSYDLIDMYIHIVTEELKNAKK